MRYYLDNLSDDEKRDVINARDSEGYTALHYAAKFNRFQIMYRLITHDAGTYNGTSLIWDRGVLFSKWPDFSG